MDTTRYWGNLPPAEMQKIVDFAEKNGFEQACQAVIPPYLRKHIKLAGRDDGRFFLPIGPSTKVLDLGCMWGGLTISLAQYAREVVGVDQTMETLQLSAIRARDLKLDNLTFIGGEATNIPLNDNQFDVVIINGVLEWVGMEAPYVCERHWGKKERINHNFSDSPRNLQRRTLQEALRVLKTGGALFLGIENRISFMYLAGFPDGHSGLRFNSLMPRLLANIYSRIRIRQPYRAYTYSERGLRSLLTGAGFEVQKVYAALDSYEVPKAIFPLRLKLLKYYYHNFWAYRWKPFQHRLFRLIYQMLLASHIARPTVHAFMVVATKSGTCQSLPASTLEELLQAHWTELFPPLMRPKSISVMKVDGRPKESAPVSFLIFSNKDLSKPLGYVKVARNAFCHSKLMQESKIYQKIHTIKGTPFLPEQYYCGTVGQYFFVTREVLKGKKFRVPCEGRFLKFKERRELNTYLNLAVFWLARLFRASNNQSMKFDDFFEHFFTSRLEEVATYDRSFLPSKDLVERYRNTLRKVSPPEIPLGPLHGDFNTYNLLRDGDKLHVVDWEYGEWTSFPVFDFLNLCFQTVVDLTAPPMEAFVAIPSGGPSTSKIKLEEYFAPFKYLLIPSSTPLGQLLNPHFTQYSQAMGLDEVFIRLSAPIFILDLLNREYGDHRFHLRSWPLFNHLLSEATKISKIA